MKLQELRNHVNQADTSHFQLTFNEDVYIYKLSRYGKWKIQPDGSKTRSKVKKKVYKMYIRTDVNGYFFGYASSKTARTWYPVSHLPLDDLVSIKSVYAKEPITPEQQYEKSCKEFLRKCDPGLWLNFQDDCKKYLETKNINDLPCFIRYNGKAKFVSLSSKFRDFNRFEIANSIKKAIDEKGSFKYSERARTPSGRDRSLSVETRGDITNAWFSSENAGCLNGSYYYLINPTTAVYGEDD